MNNIHIIPKVIMRRFKPADTSAKKWERKIQNYNNCKVDMTNKYFTNIDCIYRIFEDFTNNIIDYIETTNDERFTVKDIKNKKVKESEKEIPPYYKDRYKSLSHDEKFTGFMISKRSCSAVMTPNNRFASILELMVVGIFNRHVSKYHNEYSIKDISNEFKNLDIFLNNITPIQITLTDKPYPLDDIKNIMVLENDTHENRMNIRLRISPRITLSCSLHKCWEHPLMTSYTYNSKDIYNPKINKSK